MLFASSIGDVCFHTLHSLLSHCDWGWRLNKHGEGMSTVPCGSTITGTTVGRPSLLGNPSPEVSFAFSAPAAGVVAFSTCGSSFDTRLLLFQGASLLAGCHGGTLVRGAVPNGAALCTSCPSNAHETLSATLSSGATVTVVVEGGGELRLHLCCS